MTNESLCLSGTVSLKASFIHSEFNVPGLIGIIVFYALVFLVGIYASWKRKRDRDRTQSQSGDVMLANRNMNEIIGVFTLTATWVSGDYVNGTAEFLITPEYGLIWCLVPVMFSLAIIFNGVVYAKKMWNAGYVTMLDPFQAKYGQIQTALLYLAALFAEVAFAAMSFVVLGTSLNVIVGISYLWAVVLSAAVALFYTLLGGLSSVALTDVVQLIGIVFGLILTIPFAINHPAVASITETASGPNSWLGQLPQGPWIGNYIDQALMLFFGAVPWQIYFQRALAQKSAEKARNLSVIAGFVAIICSIPAVVVGAIAGSTDWNATGYRDVGQIPMPPCDYPLALPLVMKYLTPVPVAVIGLGAVSAAVMSSTDSCILSSSSMFAHNVYVPFRNIISQRCSKGNMVTDREIVWVLRITMIFVGIITVIIAITINSIVALIILSADIPYCVLFPQLTCVLFVPMCNAYGSFLGFIVSVFFRFAGGEHLINLPPLIKYPWYNEEASVQCFPFKTLVTLMAFMAIIGGSWITSQCARRWHWCRQADKYMFQAFIVDSDETDPDVKIALADKQNFDQNTTTDKKDNEDEVHEEDNKDEVGEEGQEDEVDEPKIANTALLTNGAG